MASSPKIESLSLREIWTNHSMCLSYVSPKWRGKATIQGGRKQLRDALYMPALVASRDMNSVPVPGQAKAATFEYIEVFYNRQRRHSGIGYQTPQQAFNNMTWKMAANGRIGSITKLSGFGDEVQSSNGSGG
jgi:hypothetical protein